MPESQGADNLVRGRFARTVLETIRRKVDGSFSDKILDEKPSRKLFIGNLSPKKPLSNVFQPSIRKQRPRPRVLRF